MTRNQFNCCITNDLLSLQSAPQATLWLWKRAKEIIDFYDNLNLNFWRILPLTSGINFILLFRVHIVKSRLVSLLKLIAPGAASQSRLGIKRSSHETHVLPGIRKRRDLSRAREQIDSFNQSDIINRQRQLMTGCHHQTTNQPASQPPRQHSINISIPVIQHFINFMANHLSSHNN